jgi:hypothetical protein
LTDRPGDADPPRPHVDLVGPDDLVHTLLAGRILQRERAPKAARPSGAAASTWIDWSTCAITRTVR